VIHAQEETTMAKKKTKTKVKAKAASKSAPKKSAAKKAPAKKPAKKAAKKATMPSVVHWEVQSRDPAKQQQFFSTLFGWKVDANNPMNYGMVSAAGHGSIGGGIGGTEDQPRVTVYVQVKSIDETLEKALSLGAQTVMPRTDIGMIIMGQFKDLEGNVIGLVED
jgi:predicted enzyme related to lactoylglutathione lyase